MTSDQFRSSPERVGAMRELLQNSILADAIVCLKDESPSLDVPLNADALASVRTAAAKSAWDNCVNLFLSLSVPLPVEPPEEEPNWGVDKSRFVYNPSEFQVNPTNNQ